MPSAREHTSATSSTARAFASAWRRRWRGARHKRSSGWSVAHEPLFSKRSRQAEHVLCHVRQNQVGRNRRDLIEARLAKFALDVVLAGEAESAGRLQTRIRRFRRGGG